MTYRKPTCELCDREAVRCYRLNPKDWSEQRRLLCTRHREQLHYTPVNYVRAYAEAAARVGL